MIPVVQIQFLFHLENTLIRPLILWVRIFYRTFDNQLEHPAGIGSAQSINSPKNLLVVLQTAASIGVPNKAKKIAVFDNLNVRKVCVDIDGTRYPRVGVSVFLVFHLGLSSENDDHYKSPKLIYKEYNGEDLTNPFLIFTDMKNIHPVQVIDLIFQIDHKNPGKYQLHEKYRGGTNNARLHKKLMKLQLFEIDWETILTVLRNHWMIWLSLKNSMKKITWKTIYVWENLTKSLLLSYMSQKFQETFRQRIHTHWWQLCGRRPLGGLFYKKIDATTSIASVDHLISFYLTNYQNQSLIIKIKFKV